MRRLHWVTLVLTAMVGAMGCEDSTGPDRQTTVVRPTQPTTLSVTPSTAIIGIGKSVKLRATMQRTDGTRTAAKGLKWATSDQLVATIGTDGSVQGVHAGSVKIDVTWGNQHSSAFVTVVSPGVGTPRPCQKPGRPPCN